MQINVELRSRLSSPGEHVLVVEYSSEEEVPQTLSVSANVPGARSQRHHVTLLHCKYRQEPALTVNVTLLRRATAGCKLCLPASLCALNVRTGSHFTV